MYSSQEGPSGCEVLTWCLVPKSRGAPGASGGLRKALPWREDAEGEVAPETGRGRACSHKPSFSLGGKEVGFAELEHELAVGAGESRPAPGEPSRHK